jgi:hypothetical protein
MSNLFGSKIGEEPNDRQDLQHEMAIHDKGFLTVEKDGLHLRQFPDEGEPYDTGLVFQSIEAAHEYAFGSWHLA